MLREDEIVVEIVLKFFKVVQIEVFYVDIITQVSVSLLVFSVVVVQQKALARVSGRVDAVCSAHQVLTVDMILGVKDGNMDSLPKISNGH